MGAGGIGSYLGARLANAGGDVTLICRGAHLAAVRERGLRFRSPSAEFTVGKVAASAQVLVLKDGVPWQQRGTDENGMFSMRGLKPGDYKVIAWEDVDPNQLFDTDFLRKFENEGKSVKIEAGAHEAVQLKAIPVE